VQFFDFSKNRLALGIFSETQRIKERAGSGYFKSRFFLGFSRFFGFLSFFHVSSKGKGFRKRELLYITV
jgi:hypothetical protein